MSSSGPSISTVRWSVVRVIFAGLLAACGDGSPTPPEETGQTVVVQVTTTGQDIDPDGYTVRLDTSSVSVDPTGTVTFENVEAGAHELGLEGVASNCSIEGEAVRTVAVPSSGGVEEAFTVACVVDFGYDLTTVACDELALQATSGIPGDLIAAGSVPAALEAPVVALVRAREGPESAFALFEATDQDDQDDLDDLALVVPLHPADLTEGGEVWIRVTDARAACEPFELTIEPLPPAEGELGTVVDALLDILESRLAILGIALQDLAATPLDEVPTALVPLAMAQRALDHPDNPESLRAIADGAAGGYPLETIDALLARAGLVEGLDEEAGLARRARSDPSADVTASMCRPDNINADPQRLSDCMNLAERLVDEFLAKLAEALDRVALGVGAAVAVDQDQRAAIRLALNLTSWSVIQVKAEAGAALPSTLLDPVVDLDPLVFAEDDDRIGSWSATIEAASEGWAPLARLTDLSLLSRAVELRLERLGVDMADLDTELTPYLEGQLSMKLGPDPMIPEQVFGPVPVDDEDWSDVSWSGANPSIEKVEHTTYRAIGTGVTVFTLRVPDAEGDPARLGGTPLNWSPLPLPAVYPLEVHVEPSDTVIDPEDPVTFRVTVENARHPDSLEVTVEQGIAADPVGSEGSYTIQYTPPPSASLDDPDSIHVEHFHRVGARENGPDRFDYAIVRFGKIVISPEPLCVDPGAEVTFAAEVRGVDNQEVVWSAGEGTIDDDGVYTAPPAVPESGVDTVRATSVEVPGLVGELVVPIGCTCSFRAELGGYNTAVIESRAAFSQATLDPYEHGVADVVLDEAGDLVSVQFEGPIFGTVFRADFLRDNWGPIPGGSTGEFDIAGSAAVLVVEPPTDETLLFTVVAGPAWWEPDTEPLRLTIDSWDDDQVTGSLEGIMLDVSHFDTEKPTIIEIDFLARTKVGGITYSNCNP